LKNFRGFTSIASQPRKILNDLFFEFFSGLLRKRFVWCAFRESAIKKTTVPTQTTTQNQIRIIGGKWRSRKLNFLPHPDLRPTPNRIRETLFNWLAPHIVGARCLDLFAGSGALGFEALSRGAHSVVMVDQSLEIIAQLRANAVLLQAEKEVSLYCHHVSADAFLLQKSPFNIVFLDPPFHKNYLPNCCAWLENTKQLAENALVYIEAESMLPTLPIPAHWKIVRQKKAGQVGYFLVRVEKL
jgi:16S rRNA (guanine966-N2)-methyltransferase